ncbi:MAG: hypothetical protein U0270_24955 [Labilithrix sp.]
MRVLLSVLAMLPLLALACAGSEPTPATPAPPPSPPPPPAATPVAATPLAPPVNPPRETVIPTVDKLLKVGMKGTPESSWGSAGVAALRVHPALVSADGAGGVYVFDQRTAGANDNRVVATHLSPSGAADVAFGQGGELVLGAAGTTLLQGVTLDAKSRVVLLVSQRAATASQPSLIAYRFAGGKLDPSFNGGGASTVTIPAPAVSRATGAVAIASDNAGRVVIAGTDDPAAKRQVFVVRLTETGSVDPSFARGVAVSSHSSFAYDVARVVVDSGNGSVVVVANKSVQGGVVSGGAETAPAGSGIALFRFDGNGMADSKYGTGGAAVIDDQSCVGLDAFSANGSVVVGGYTGGTPATMKPVLIRWHENGTLDSGFGSGGKLVLGGMAGATLGRVRRVARDGMGRVVAVGGYRTGQDTAVTFVSRLDKDGKLDASYGTGGTASFNVQAAEPEIDPQGSVFFRAP